MANITADGRYSCMSDDDVIRQLNDIDQGYSILYRIGIGIGAKLSQLLMLNVSDIKGKEYISMPVGPLQIRRTFVVNGKYFSRKNGILFS